MPTWLRNFIGRTERDLSVVVRCCLTRGLYPSPKVPHRHEGRFDTFVWHTEPRTMPSGCRVFTDGSLLDGDLGKEFASLGWAFAVIDEVGDLVAAA